MDAEKLLTGITDAMRFSLEAIRQKETEIIESGVMTQLEFNQYLTDQNKIIELMIAGRTTEATSLANKLKKQAEKLEQDGV